MPTTTSYQHRLAFFSCGLLLFFCTFIAPDARFSHAAPTQFKVLEIVFDPIIEAQAGVRLTQLKHWTQPAAVDAQYIADIQAASHGYVQYSIQRVLVDAIP